MAITLEFMDAVQSGQALLVRIMLKDSLLVDPTATQFDEMVQYANNQMGSIYVEHDGENLNFDVNAWNENYLNEQMVIVVNNFSQERINLLKRMVSYLFKEKINRIRSERDDTQTSHNITRKQVGTGVTVVGAVLAVAGICTSPIVMTIGGVAVAVAGVALILSDKENN